MNISILVLTYNHEKYIQECLESIRYQLEHYNCSGAHKVQVVVTDDCSKDTTKQKVMEWIQKRGELFDDFVFTGSEINQGTCRNYLRGLEKVTGDYVKVIGGDDMFGMKSIFEMFAYLAEYDIVMGLPFIYFEGGENKAECINKEARKTHFIYTEESKLPYYDWIHRYCFPNAPSNFFRKELQFHQETLSALYGHKYIDDYIQWIKFSEIKNISCKYIPEFVTVYRRTEGSAYLIVNKEVREELVKTFQYARERAREKTGKAVQTSAIYMQKSNHPIKYFDLLSYIHKLYLFKHRRDKSVNFEDDIKLYLNYITEIKERCRAL